MIRLATPDDAGFILEMARHACVIEDWPLPDPESEEKPLASRGTHQVKLIS